MEALLRELHEGPDGIPEYRDTEISGDELTIGSAADQRIQLLGRAVAPEHAVIRKSGSKLELELPRRAAGRGERRAGLVREARSRRCHRAGRSQAADRGAAAAASTSHSSCEPNENIDASEFESAFRTDLMQTWLSKRPAAWMLVAIVLIFGVALPDQRDSHASRGAGSPRLVARR